MAKKVLVLGGGYAGVLTAKHIEKQVKKKKLSDVEITLIDKNPYHTMLTELHEVAANRVEEDSIKMNLKKIFAGRNVNVVLDEVTTIDKANNKVVGKNANYDYDYLVLGTGSKPAFFGVKGAEEHSFTLWSFDDAVRLKEHTLKMFRLAEAETDAQKRKQYLTFVVVGGGFSGVEMMGELAEWVPTLCHEYHIDKEDVTLKLVDMMPRILNAIPEKLATKATNYMEKQGVEVLCQTGVSEIFEDAITYKQGEKEIKMPTSTVIWTAGIEGSQVVKDDNLGSESSRGNRVATNDYLQSLENDNIYVVGDNLDYKPEGHERPVPQMVENCEHSAHTASHNIMVDLMGKGEKEAYNPKFHGAMVCVGGRWGTAHVGMPGKFFALPSFFAMLSKHFINIIYFIQVLGWNKIWNYIDHEFFKVKHNRSFVGGLLANNQPTFWSTLLRLWIGLTWFMEGIVKFEKITQNYNNIFLFSLPENALPDGVTAASVEVVHNLPQIVYTFAEYSFEGAKALPVPEFMTNIMNWSMGVFIAPVAPHFQALMVTAELVIGLCLIGGLFTSLASLAGFVLSIMIYMSGMANKEIIWLGAGCLALVSIGGTGHVLSLDYYVLPWLKKQWKKLKFVKKWYIYND